MLEEIKQNQIASGKKKVGRPRKVLKDLTNAKGLTMQKPVHTSPSTNVNAPRQKATKSSRTISALTHYSYAHDHSGNAKSAENGERI